MLKQFSKTLAAHRSGILAYFDFDGLSTGPLEGTNNKIKTLHKIMEWTPTTLNGINVPK